MKGKIKIRALAGLLCCIFFGGCANGDGLREQPGLQEQPRETGGVSFEESVSQPEEKEQPEQTTFSAVPYFDEDTNGMLQYADGWLYGYLGGSIFRMDADTGELSVLFETAGSRSMHFCIDDGFLYFLAIPQITFVDGVKADLYRMNCDGSDIALLAEALPVTVLSTDIYDDENNAIKMSVYEDVLYIMLNREAVCLQLLDDGGVWEVACEDTLYGLLPDGYFALDSYDIFPSIPYCAAHYGYFFAVNSDGRMIRVDAKSGLWESIPGQIDYRQGFVTHENVYLVNREEQKWIRYSLEDITQSSDWREYDSGHPLYTKMIGWEENGVFLIQRKGIVQLVFVDWEGKETPLVSFPQQILYTSSLGKEYYYIRDGWLYYRDEREGEAWLMRISCEGGEPEKLYCYYVRPGKGLTESETVEKNRENTGELRVSTSITKLWLKEGEEGAAKINAALKEIYKEAEAEMEAFNQEMLDENLFEDGMLREDLDEWLNHPLDEWLAFITENYEAFIEYADENYLCLCMSGYNYSGGAHGYYWDDHYAFDRHTGKRLTLEDFVNNSPEEIKEIVKNYILAVEPYSGGEQSEDALEPDRFFLTAEGFGIHYDVYEIGSYVEGPCDLIIPFELFDMKVNMWGKSKRDACQE